MTSQQKLRVLDNKLKFLKTTLYDDRDNLTNNEIYYIEKRIQNILIIISNIKR